MVTYVGAGTSSEGSNAPRTPGLPAGVTAGDLLLCLAAIRNSPDGYPDTPAGWTLLAGAANVRLFGKVAAAGEIAPTITFSGGVFGATNHAQIAAWRGGHPTVLSSDELLNPAAQDITYPAMSAGTRCLAIWAGWKQDDWTSVAELAAGTEIGEESTTSGDDAAIVWDYAIVDSPTTMPGGAFVVTGGTAAISRALVLTLATVGITAVTQDVWPVRVQVTVTGLIAGDLVTIDRVQGSTRTAVRGADAITATDPSLVVVDAELPFGVAVSYEVTIDGVVTASTAPATYTLTGGKVALSDAITGQAAEVAITAWPSRRRVRAATRFDPGGRPVVVAGPLGGAEGQIEVLTMTDVSRDALIDLIAAATSGVLQLRQPGGYGGVDCYIAVLDVTENRVSQDGSDQRRKITLSVVEVDPWPAGFAARGWTLADLAAAYTGLTLADLAGDYSTLLAVAQADWGP
jgi:hypothetical protein